MGMYTELAINVNLSKDLPVYALKILRFMLGESDERPTPSMLTGTLFRASDRWRHMLQSTSFYFDGCTLHKLEWNEIDWEWHFSVRCNFKNYDNEIENFLAWLKPWINTEGFYGYWRYEEHADPTLLYNEQL